MGWNADTGQPTQLAKGYTIGRLGDTDSGDRRVFANGVTRLRDEQSLGAARIPLRRGGPRKPQRESLFLLTRPGRLPILTMHSHNAGTLFGPDPTGRSR